MLSQHQVSKLFIFIKLIIFKVTTILDTADLPSFLRVDCPKSGAESAEMCIDVLYPDGFHDLLLMSRPYKMAPSVLKGTLKSDPTTKVVVILGDEFIPGTKVFDSEILSIKFEPPINV